MFTRPTELTAKAFQEAYFNDLKPEVFDNVMRTNAFGPYWLTFAFLPLLEKWKEVGYSATTGGRKFAPQVIMTSSMNGWTKDNATGGKCFPYQFSKSAIGHATSTIAHELLPLGIRVNGIAPGMVRDFLSLALLLKAVSYRTIYYRNDSSGHRKPPWHLKHPSKYGCRLRSSLCSSI